MTERKAVVLTSDLIKVVVRADRWSTTRWRAQDGETQNAVALFIEPTAHPVAEFPDIVAVFFEDMGEIIPPEEDE